jgi:hypothetical protein
MRPDPLCHGGAKSTESATIMKLKRMEIIELLRKIFTECVKTASRTAKVLSQHKHP